MADKLRPRSARAGKPAARPAAPKPESGASRTPPFDKKLLWEGTILPATDADNWLTSGSAAYWAILKKLPDDP